MKIEDVFDSLRINIHDSLELLDNPPDGNYKHWLKMLGENIDAIIKLWLGDTKIDNS